MPRTYVLPTDLKELKVAWRRDGGKRKWIIKPVSGAGTGRRWTLRKVAPFSIYFWRSGLIFYQ